MDKWSEIRTAYLVAQHGTISGAAEAMGVHRATVNRHIDLLERELGQRIFLRHAKGYSLTDIGVDLLKVAQKTEELIEDFSGRARGRETQIDGEIKVTTLPPFAEVLMKPIAQFRSDNPNCRVTIVATEDLERLEYGDAHVALRAGPEPRHPDYVVELYAQITLNLYAHESYIEQMGIPKRLEDLKQHLFVLPSDDHGQLPFSKWTERNVAPHQVAVSSRHDRVVRAAVFAGLGLGFLSELDVMSRQDTHRVLPETSGWSVPLWLVTHVDLHRTTKVQAMLHRIRENRSTELI